MPVEDKRETYGFGINGSAPFSNRYETYEGVRFCVSITNCLHLTYFGATPPSASILKWGFAFQRFHIDIYSLNRK